MKKKNLAICSLVLVLCFVLCSSAALAKDAGRKGEDGFSLERKVLRKLGMVIRYQEDLGLTDEQVAQIRDLKVSVQKDLVKKQADIKLLAIDIKTALAEDTIDTKAVGKLIDKKYAVKKDKAMVLVKAYAELKKMLTDEQQKKFKTILRTRKK